MFKVKKMISLFTMMGIMYLIVELIMRIGKGDLIGFMGLKTASLAGWTSAWLWIVGVATGYLLGLVNEYETLKKQKMIVKCLMGVLIIFTLEFLCGCVLNIQLDLHLWGYEGWPGVIMGQICLPFGIVWLLLCPFIVWFDDIIRFLVYDQGHKYRLSQNYKELFTLK